MGVASVLDVQFFFIEENWICARNRHHAEWNIQILLARYLSIDCGVRQWSHPLMIPLHCLWAESNNRTCGQFECDVTWFYFCLNSFVHMHGAVVVLFWKRWGEGGSFKIGRPRWRGQGGGGSWKLDIFHGRHMCIVPYIQNHAKHLEWSVMQK